MQREFYGDWVANQRRVIWSIMGLLAPVAFAAIAISGLGLFGLAAFLAEQRTKEIGVRKALGAGRRQLLRMLVFQFTRPVLVAALIATPIVFLLLNLLMQQAPPNQRIMPSPMVYAVVVGTAILIALLATFSHAWRVTGAPPVKALRYE
jgi:putative ABC transport system permease protein